MYSNWNAIIAIGEDRVSVMDTTSEVIFSTLAIS